MEWYLLEEHAQNPAQCHPEKEKMVMFLEEQSKADKIESNYYIFSHCIVSYFIQVTGVRIGRKIGKTIGLPYWGTKRGNKGAAT